MVSEIMVRFSDFMKHVPYHLVLRDVEQNLFYHGQFLKFNAFFPTDKGKRFFTVIFPKYKFRRAYLSHPRSVREKIGNNDVFIEIYKRNNSRLEITRLEKWVGQGREPINDNL